jgi:hypothetical protein
MYTFILLIHVISAVLLGSYFVLPFQIKKMVSLSNQDIVSYIRVNLLYIKIGHYAMVSLLISGVIMIIDSHYSLLWILSALFLLLVIGGCIGMIQMRLKRIDTTNSPSEQFKKGLFIYLSF